MWLVIEIVLFFHLFIYLYEFLCTLTNKISNLLITKPIWWCSETPWMMVWGPQLAEKSYSCTIIMFVAGWPEITWLQKVNNNNNNSALNLWVILILKPLLMGSEKKTTCLIINFLANPSSLFGLISQRIFSPHKVTYTFLIKITKSGGTWFSPDMKSVICRVTQDVRQTSRRTWTVFSSEL